VQVTGRDVDPRDEILRQFNEIIAGLGVGELSSLSEVRIAQTAAPRRAASLRRPRREAPALLVIRVDINRAAPPIWRRLEVRSDITLATFHRVLQAAFDWWDYHLHRFSLGSDPFDPNAELFLCEYDVEEGDDVGEPDSDVHLDETLTEPGDVLHYVYDYGDNWDLRITLESVLPVSGAPVLARCVDGRRAAPPEDSGGVRTEAELAEVMGDPTTFDIAAVNSALLDPFTGLAESGLRRDLVDLLNRLRGTPTGDDLVVRAVGLTLKDATNVDERAAALHPILWFLDHVGTTGLTLTAAGYLRPDDVMAASRVIPDAVHWIGARNREVQTTPVLDFRQMLQSTGLLRKAKGRLLLTKAGLKANGDTAALWRHLAQRLPLSKPNTFEGCAELLLLIHIASAPHADPPYAAIATAMTELGWRRANGEPVSDYQVMWADEPTRTLLTNMVTGPRVHASRLTEQFSAVAADLARACLLSADGKAPR
jgi:hypothetical protein